MNNGGSRKSLYVRLLCLHMMSMFSDQFDFHHSIHRSNMWMDFGFEYCWCQLSLAYCSGYKLVYRCLPFLSLSGPHSKGLWIGLQSAVLESFCLLRWNSDFAQFIHKHHFFCMHSIPDKILYIPPFFHNCITKCHLTFTPHWKGLIRWVYWHIHHKTSVLSVLLWCITFPRLEECYHPSCWCLLNIQGPTSYLSLHCFCFTQLFYRASGKKPWPRTARICLLQQTILYPVFFSICCGLCPFKT